MSNIFSFIFFLNSGATVAGGMAVQVPVGPPVVANGVEQQAVTAVSFFSIK